MMKPMYCVRDLKIGFLPPFTDVNDEAATRGFQYAMNKPDTLEFTNIDDYQLFKVGEYDTETGIIKPITPEFVCNAMEVN